MLNESLIKYQEASPEERLSIYKNEIHDELTRIIKTTLARYYLNADDRFDASQELRLVFLKLILTRDFSQIKNSNGFLYRCFDDHMKDNLRAIIRRRTFDEWMNGLVKSSSKMYAL